MRLLGRGSLHDRVVSPSSEPPTEAERAEIDALQSKMQKMMRIVAVLLLIAVAAMASARYL